MKRAAGRLEAWVHRWWRSRAGPAGHVLSLLTLPLELLFRAGVALRSRGYDAGVLPGGTLPVPVISVGNLAVGGTGKTPVAAWVVERLLEAGHRPAVAARGYGEDELELHRRWHPDVAVHADPRRFRAGTRAVEAGATVVVLDDGFQHRHLRRDLDLVLISAEHPLPVRLLPRGPYREPLRALERADLVLLTRKTAGADEVGRWTRQIRRAAPDTPLARLHFRVEGWLGLDGERAEAPEAAALAVAGVAGPDTFLAMVREAVGEPAEVMLFPDHHDYGPEDVEEMARRARGGTVVTTEKDAVKLAGHGHRLDRVRVLRIVPVFEEDGERVRGAVAEAARGRATPGAAEGEGRDGPVRPGAGP